MIKAFVLAVGRQESLWFLRRNCTVCQLSVAIDKQLPQYKLVNIPVDGVLCIICIILESHGAFDKEIPRVGKVQENARVLFLKS